MEGVELPWVELPEPADTDFGIDAIAEIRPPPVPPSPLADFVVLREPSPLEGPR